MKMTLHPIHQSTSPNPEDLFLSVVLRHDTSGGYDKKDEEYELARLMEICYTSKDWLPEQNFVDGQTDTQTHGLSSFLK